MNNTAQARALLAVAENKPQDGDVVMTVQRGCGIVFPVIMRFTVFDQNLVDEDFGFWDVAERHILSYPDTKKGREDAKREAQEWADECGGMRTSFGRR